MHLKRSYHTAINNHRVLFKSVLRLFEGSLSMLFMFLKTRVRGIKCPVSVAARILMCAALVGLTVGLRGRVKESLTGGVIYDITSGDVINAETLTLHSSWNC